MLVLPGRYIILPKFLVTTKASKAAANIPSAIRRNTFWLLWPLCFWIWWVTQHPSIWNPLPRLQGGPGLLDRWVWVSSPNLDPIIENLRIISTPNATPKQEIGAYQLSTIIVPPLTRPENSWVSIYLSELGAPNPDFLHGWFYHPDEFFPFPHFFVSGYIKVLR